MKRLTVLRHAKSRSDDPVQADFDRPLAVRGRESARRLGLELDAGRFQVDFVLASPAARVRETIEAIQEKFGFKAPIRYEPRLYLAEEGLLLDLLRALPATVEFPLLAGHNPGLQDLVLRLTSSAASALRDRVADKFPTAALAVLDVPTKDWRTLGAGVARLVEMIVPADLT